MTPEEIADAFLMELTARHCESSEEEPMTYTEAKEHLATKIQAYGLQQREEGARKAVIESFGPQYREQFALGRKAGLEEAAEYFGSYPHGEWNALEIAHNIRALVVNGVNIPPQGKEKP